MKRKISLISGLVVLMVFLSGCDPIYPPGKIKTEPIHTLDVGESLEIKIIYPTGGIAVIGWKDQTIEVIKNPEVISVSGMRITGVKSGTATMIISVMTVLTEGAYENGDEDREYSITVKVLVK